VVGLILATVLAGLTAPLTFRCRKAANRTQAINNAKQVGLALLEFDQEFGSFPSYETVPEVRKASKVKYDLSGSSSNAMFRQLIAFGIQSEDIFYCLHHESIRKPDRNLSPGKALEAGEVGFSYISGQKSSDNPARVVLAAPIRIGATTAWTDTFKGKAVLLRIDNSVEAPAIRQRDHKIPIGNGKTLLETGADTVWGVNTIIDLRHPEPGG